MQCMAIAPAGPWRRPKAWAYANQRSIDLYAVYSWPLMAAAVPLTLYVTIDTAQMVLYTAFTILACVWPWWSSNAPQARASTSRAPHEPNPSETAMLEMMNCKTMRFLDMGRFCWVMVGCTYDDLETIGEPGWIATPSM